jgi:protein TonB
VPSLRVAARADLPPASASEIPRWLIAAFVSAAVHGTIVGWVIAWLYADAQLWAQRHPSTRHGPQVVVAELVTRRAAPPSPVSPQGRAAPHPPELAAVDSDAGSGEDSYFARLRDHLSGFRGPLDASRAGVAQVRFNIEPDGSVDAVALARSSGNSEIDREALALIGRAAPLPQPPREMTVQVPVEFR